jgi:hypothetical protein
MALGADQCHRLTSLWETAEQQQQQQQQPIGGNEAVGGESERGNGVKDLCEKLFAVGSMEGGEAGDFDLAMQVTEPCSMFVTCLHLTPYIACIRCGHILCLKTISIWRRWARRCWLAYWAVRTKAERNVSRGAAGSTSQRQVGEHRLSMMLVVMRMETRTEGGAQLMLQL